jgi:glycosyltransferase involved in cell wall biosynthesis
MNMTADQPIFALIVPTYNRPELIHCSIESALSQTYSHWVLVICDDGSTADYTTVRAGITDPRIHFLCNPRNGGCNQARNLAINEAVRLGAHYMVLLDDKDKLDPLCLEYALLRIKAHPDIGWFVSNTFGDSKPSSRAIAEEGSLDWIDDYCYGKTLRGDKTHIISLAVLEGIRFDGRYRTSNMWPFYLPLSARTRIWAYPYPSKKIHYLAGGITKSSSRYPRSWLEIYSRIARHVLAIWLRPAKLAAYRNLLLETIKTPKRILYLYFRPKTRPPCKNLTP